MPDKKDWLELIYKLAVAILGIVLGVNQYQQNQAHKEYDKHVAGWNCHVDPVKIISVHKNKELVALHDNKKIKFMELPDEKVRSVLLLPAEKQYGGVVHPFVPPAIDLGMGNVPVLDQGEEGTCVTFSSTAALDALLSEFDFISQQCSLMLDDALGSNYWNGANMPSDVVSPLQQYGVVSQSDCPSQYPDTSASIDPDTYQTLVSSNESAIVASVQLQYFAAPDLNALKAALRAGNRVLIGIHIYTGMQQAVQGFDVNGNVGGLWACKQGKSQNYCRNSSDGHEVLVVGYDDSQELLKIRNSWGSGVGDGGDFYMTYKFFQAMDMDMTAVK